MVGRTLRPKPASTSTPGRWIRQSPPAMSRRPSLPARVWSPICCT
ncbi:hypothetical protein ACRAWD_31035 [Caulobacter segnis]